jgi:hypothetical protein
MFGVSHTGTKTRGGRRWQGEQDALAVFTRDLAGIGWFVVPGSTGHPKDGSGNGDPAQFLAAWNANPAESHAISA